MDLSQIAGPEIAWLVLALLAGGIVAGLLAGLFGIGGGAVLVPILFELFRLLGVPDDIRMHLSVGTSLAVIAPTAIRSFAEHRRRGAVDMAVLRNMGPAVGDRRHRRRRDREHGRRRGAEIRLCPLRPADRGEASGRV